MMDIQKTVEDTFKIYELCFQKIEKRIGGFSQEARIAATNALFEKCIDSLNTEKEAMSKLYG